MRFLLSHAPGATAMILIEHFPLARQRLARYAHGAMEANPQGPFFVGYEAQWVLYTSKVAAQGIRWDCKHSSTMADHEPPKRN